MARDVARLERLWREMGNTGDLPAGWNGPGGSPEKPNYTPFEPVRIPTAQELIAEETKKLQEQITFLKDFLASNPTGYDEVLARQMAEQKYKPYYEEILNDFVAPMQEKISRSVTDENQAITELTRQTQSGEREQRLDLLTAIDKAKEGFAGAGLFGSGTAKRSVNQANIYGENKIGDYLSNQAFKQTTLQQTGQRERTDYQTAIDQRNRDIFGQGRAFDTAVAGDVQEQETLAQKQLGLKALDAVSSRFGQPLIDIPGYLNLYTGA